MVVKRKVKTSTTKTKKTHTKSLSLQLRAIPEKQTKAQILKAISEEST